MPKFWSYCYSIIETLWTNAGCFTIFHITEAADSLSAVEGDSASDSVFNIPDNISIFDSTRNQPHHQQGV